MNPDPTVGAVEASAPEPAQTWPLAPDVSRELGGLLSIFATSMAGGVLVLLGLGTGVLPTTYSIMGATPGMRLDRERQQRCMELGITPEELASLEQRELEVEQ